MKKRLKKRTFWKLRNLTNGWYLCCQRHLCHANPNIYARESIFRWKRNSTIQFSYQNDVFIKNLKV